VTETLLIISAVVLVYMTLWFALALRTGRNDLADVAWGPGFLLVAAVSHVHQGGITARGVLVLALVATWAIRLAFHIGFRGRGAGEDPRYRKWREEWGESVVWRSFLQVFMLQGALLVVISLPVIRVCTANPSLLGPLDVLGAGLWAVGLGFEAVADAQLASFKRLPSPKPRFLREGLWRYSRHPNYFGEVLAWWGIYVIALAVPGGWATVLGPVTITVLILWVSGVPLLESRYAGVPEFEDYRQTTNAFFPWRPKTSPTGLAADNGPRS
jgi:steroid 5-alpha reductase family enzyme